VVQNYGANLSSDLVSFLNAKRYNLGDQDKVIEYDNEKIIQNSTFKLCVISFQPNLSFSHDMCAKFNIVNFALSHKSLEQQITTLIFQIESLDL
jgi:hypothetical protein